MIDGLPDPAAGARSLVPLGKALAESVPVVGSLLSLAMQGIVDRRIAEARSIIEGELRRRGVAALEELSEEQRDWFIPAGYRFFEQVRLGDHAYTLRVLASLIAGELGRDDRDTGRVLRAARRLEGIRLIELESIAHIPQAVEIQEKKRGDKARERMFSVHDLCDAMGHRWSDIELRDSARELVWRGIILQDVGYIRGDGPGSDLFVTTIAFDEIVEAARSVVTDGG